MIIKLNHPDGTEMSVETDGIIDCVEIETKNGSYTNVYFEEHFIVCKESISEIQSMIGGS